MKIRIGFVTNSSSTAYMIINKTKTNKTAINFINENADLLAYFNDMNKEWGEQVTKEELIASAKDHKLLIFPPDNEDEYESIAIRVDELGSCGTLFATFVKWVAYNTDLHRRKESESFVWESRWVEE